jgi:hypothetical protein
MDYLPMIILAALWVVPTWRILQRVGGKPALSLLAIIPVAGPMIVFFILAYGEWPRFDRKAGA